MERGRVARVGRALAVVAVVSVAAGVVLGLKAALDTRSLLPYFLHLSLVPLAATTFAILGALIVANQPGNAIGWLFLVASLCDGVQTVCLGAPAALHISGSPTAAFALALIQWLADWLWLPGLVFPSCFIFLIFPDGHLPSDRWRPIAWSAILGTAGTVIAILISPGSLPVWGITAINPLGLPLPGGLLNLGVNFFGILLVVGVFGSFAAFIFRFRSARGEVRQQLKWLAYAAVLAMVAFTLAAVIWFAVPDPELALLVGNGLTGAAVLAVCVAAAAAVLKYRLFDINLLIRRTLVYSVLTVMVAGMYALLVGAAGVLIPVSPWVPSLILTIFAAALVLPRSRPALQRKLDNWLVRSPHARAAHLAPTQIPEPGEGFRPLPADTALSARAQRWATIAWFLAAGLAIVVFGLSLPGYAVKLSLGPTGLQTDRASVQGMVNAFAALSVAASIFTVLLSYGLAVLLFQRRRTHPMALFVSFYLILFATLLAGPAEQLGVFLPESFNDVLRVEALLGSFPTLILFLTFPSGRFVPGWTRYLAPVGAGAALLFLVIPPMTGMVMGDPKVWPVLGLWLVLMVVALVSQVMRYRQTATELERQQMKLAMGGLTAWWIVITLSSIPYALREALPAGQPTPWWALASESVWFLSFILPPGALAVAVLRYHLWDLEILVSRALMYTTLTAGVAGLYIVIVGGLSLIFQASGGFLVTLVATGVVAVLFQPLRTRVQQAVNRFLYGDRDDPYAALARLGRRLEESLAPDSALPTIVETVAEALKLPYTALALRREKGTRVVAEYGLPSPPLVTLELQYRGERIGDLIVAARGPAEPFSEQELTLLADLAHQAGIALHAAQLTEDLRKSREDLVLAREEERRRLRRDLHDGLGPELASLTLKLDAARNLLRQDSQAADDLLLEVKSQVQESLANVRRLVYNLRPPALDELGLIPAVRESSPVRAASQTSSISVTGPESLPPLPAAVEVAAYRIALEAVTNVVRHAGAASCEVRFRLADGLELVVTDDGRGLAKDARPGVGLASMRERARELGGTIKIGPGPTGGTKLQVHLPLSRAGG